MTEESNRQAGPPAAGLDSGIVCSCIDKQGVPFEVGAYLDDDQVCLIDMYDCFSPKACSQGLPPKDDDARRDWVTRLYRDGINFLARCEGKVVGHAGLMPDKDRTEAEFIIFVDQGYRNRGLGTQLTAMAIDKGRALGLERIWLSVEVFNFRAIAVYKKFGFEFCEACDRERIMNLVLADYHEPEAAHGS